MAQSKAAKIDIRWAVGVLIAVAVVAAVVAVVRFDPTGEKASGLSAEYAYDIGKLAEIDPNLILYSQSGPPVKTGFSRSRAIALDPQGRVYVAGDSAIRVFDGAGNVERMVELSDEPQCLAVADDGRIYVGLKDHIEVLDADGRARASWSGLADGAVVTSIALHGDSVFVADAGRRVVLHYDVSGAILGRIGEKDPDRNIPGFIIPSPHFDLVVSRDGLLRVVNPGRCRIEAYTFTGDLEFWWGERSVAIEGFCGCCNPVSVALLPDSGFVTAEKGLERVKVYNSDGGFVGVVAGADQLGRRGLLKVCDTPEQCQGAVLDVAAGPDGRVCVLDTAENLIRVFSRKEVRP